MKLHQTYASAMGPVSVWSLAGLVKLFLVPRHLGAGFQILLARGLEPVKLRMANPGLVSIILLPERITPEVCKRLQSAKFSWKAYILRIEKSSAFGRWSPKRSTGLTVAIELPS